MRDDRPSNPQVVTSISTMHSAICHSGGVSAMMRTNIRIGAKNGTIEVQKASAELGCWSTGVLRTIEKMIGSMAGHCTCCAMACHATDHLLDCPEHAGTPAPQFSACFLDLDGSVFCSYSDVRAHHGRNPAAVADCAVHCAYAGHYLGIAGPIVAHLPRRHSDVRQAPYTTGVA